MTGSGARGLEPPRDVADIEELLDQITDQISIWDDQVRLVHANSTVLAWTGRTLADSRGLRFCDIVGADIDELLSPFFAAAATGTPVSYRRRLAGPGGTTYDLIVRVSALLRDGALAGYVMIGIDRAALVGAQAAQRESAARSALRSERDRVAGELDGEIRRRLEIVRRRLDSGVATGTDRDVDAVVGELDSVISEIRNVISRLREPVGAAVDEPSARVPRSDPGPTWNAALGSAIGGDASSSWDVDTALAFVDVMPGISVWNSELICCFANRPAVRGIGKSSRDDMIGRGRVELFGPEVAARGLPFAKAAARGVGQRYDSYFVDGEGMSRRVHFVYHPVIRNGNAIGVVAVLHEVDTSDSTAEWSETVDTLTVYRQRIAEDLHDYVIQYLYAAGLALGAVTGVELPRHGAEHASQSIVAAIRTLETSTHALHGDPAGDLVEIIERVVRQAGPAIGFAPRLDLIGDPRHINPGVSSELLAVLTEALSNIARHANAHDVHVTVSTTVDTTWLRVTDDGIGIGHPHRSSGLSNMTHRAQRLGGTFTCGPNTPRGTFLDWRVPI